MKLYIGADLGTSALKLLLVNTEGEIINSVTKEYPVFFPESGWSEQNPADWWSAFVEGVAELTENVCKSDVSGIGVGGQMHGLVILDENDNVIRPAILWNDGRTAEETDYLNKTVGESFLAGNTANIAFAGFTAPKLLWVKNNEKDNFDKIQKIMLPKDYINYRLTGKHVTDYSDASGMLLLDVENKCWSDEMLNICSINKEQLPRLHESYDNIGTLLPDVAELLGLGDSVSVCAGAGDNAAAAIGTGTVKEGMCNISLGTSGTVFVPTSAFKPLSNNAIHNFCHSNGGYHLMGCILSAASCNKWFCDEILGTKDYSAEQQSVEDCSLGNNDVFFIPYLMGERSPLNDTDARGGFIGMRLDTKRSDMVLAVLEGVAFAVRDNLEIVRNAGVSVDGSTLCGGGARSPLWCKILANVLNIDISLPVSEEGPGFGGAVLAMVANGEYKSVSECCEKFTAIKSVISPDSEIVERYNRRYEQYRSIYPCLKDFFKKYN